MQSAQTPAALGMTRGAFYKLSCFLFFFEGALSRRVAGVALHQKHSDTPFKQWQPVHVCIQQCVKVKREKTDIPGDGGRTDSIISIRSGWAEGRESDRTNRGGDGEGVVAASAACLSPLIRWPRIFCMHFSLILPCSSLLFTSSCCDPGIDALKPRLFISVSLFFFSLFIWTFSLVNQTHYVHSHLPSFFFAFPPPAECRMMKGPKGQRGSAKSPVQIIRSKSPAESSESIINSVVQIRQQTDLALVAKPSSKDTRQ